MNKYSIGKFNLDCLAQEYGTPLYVMNGNAIIKRANAFNKAKQWQNLKVIFAYANKAFCSLATTKLLNKQGFYFDVVSSGEIAVILEAGVEPSKIIFHGNNKTEQEIKYALEKKIGYFVVDNYSEYARINKFAKIKQNIIVRINPCIRAETHSAVQTANWDSKFGFTMSQETLDVISEIAKNNNFEGIHIHIGSQIFGVKSYLEAIDKIIPFIKQIINEGININILDLGGGFGIRYTENDPNIDDETISNNLSKILEYLNKSLTKEKIKVKTVIFEPGRSLVANAGCTVYKVGDIKKYGDKKTYIVVDGGMYESPRFALYGSKYTVSAVNNYSDKKTNKVTIVGKCCESGDIIAEDVMIQNVEIGDYIVVESTGAYNFSMASNYNNNLVQPVVLVIDDKKEIIVKGQNINDLISRNVVPEWL